MVNLEYLISNSGDSILEDYLYSRGVLTITLNLTEINKIIKLRIKTEHLLFDKFYLEKENIAYRTCRIEIQELSNILSIKNGVYIPSDTFGKFMNETKQNYNLAYGRKATDLKYIFSLLGYGRLVSCLLSDLNCIELLW